MAKVDFLQECMSEFKNAPIDAFNKEFCVVCSNRECTRSWGNASGFDNRVKNWREVLFTNVQRVDNPDFGNQKFEPVGRTPEIAPSAGFEPLSYDDIPDTDPAPAPTAAVQSRPVEPTKPESSSKPVQKPTGLPAANTPFNQPVMIGNQKNEEKTESPGCVFVFDDE